MTGLHDGDCDLSCYLQLSAVSFNTFMQLVMESVDRRDIRSAFLCGIMAQWAGQTYMVLRALHMATAQSR